MQGTTTLNLTFMFHFQISSLNLYILLMICLKSATLYSCHKEFLSIDIHVFNPKTKPSFRFTLLIENIRPFYCFRVGVLLDDIK